MPVHVAMGFASLYPSYEIGPDIRRIRRFLAKA
jgi:hypothetical protein